MGRFVNLPSNRFRDFAYQPDFDLQLKKSQAQIVNDSLKRSTTNLGDLGIPGTWSEWQQDEDADVNQFNTKIDEVAKVLSQNPGDMKALGELNNLKKEITTAYSSGDIGKRARLYNDYQAKEQELASMIEKAKTPEEKQAIVDRRNDWRAHVSRNVKKGYSDEFAYSDFLSPVNQQNFLKDNIDVENLKYHLSSDKTDTPVYLKNGKYTEVPNNGEVISENGKNYFVDKQGNKHQVGTARDLIINQVPGLKHKKYYDTDTVEGFQQDAIVGIAYQELLNNPAVISMLKQNYNDFEQGRVNEQGETVSLDEYIQNTILEEAVRFGDKHPQITKETSVATLLDDKAGLADDAFRRKQALEAQKQRGRKDLAKYKKGLDKEEVTPENLVSNTFLENSYNLYQEGYFKGLDERLKGYSGNGPKSIAKTKEALEGVKQKFFAENPEFQGSDDDLLKASPEYATAYKNYKKLVEQANNDSLLASARNDNFKNYLDKNGIDYSNLDLTEGFFQGAMINHNRGNFSTDNFIIPEGYDSMEDFVKENPGWEIGGIGNTMSANYGLPWIHNPNLEKAYEAYSNYVGEDWEEEMGNMSSATNTFLSTNTMAPTNDYLLLAGKMFTSEDTQINLYDAKDYLKTNHSVGDFSPTGEDRKAEYKIDGSGTLSDNTFNMDDLFKVAEIDTNNILIEPTDKKGKSLGKQLNKEELSKAFDISGIDYEDGKVILLGKLNDDLIDSGLINDDYDGEEVAIVFNNNYFADDINNIIKENKEEDTPFAFEGKSSQAKGIYNILAGPSTGDGEETVPKEFKLYKTEEKDGLSAGAYDFKTYRDASGNWNAEYKLEGTDSWLPMGNVKLQTQQFSSQQSLANQIATYFN